MKTIVCTMIAAAFALAIAAPAIAASIDGAWSAKVPAPNGQVSLDVVFNFRVDGSKLTGTVAIPDGQSFRLVDTSIDGDDIAFAVEGETARYTGKMSGDEIKMQVTFKSSENGTRKWDFVARRAAPQERVDYAIVDGMWTGEVPRGGGQFIAADFELRADGSTLTGRVHALDNDYPVNNGTVAGARITFKVGATRGEYTGEVAGNTIRMKVKYDGGENGRQTLDFVLKRIER